MSIQKWHQLAEEKSAEDQQTQDIHQKFRMNKISKEFGQLSGKELFKPITKRLDENSSTTTQEVEESPDYAIDEFDRTNPFGDEFRPDAPTPAPSPPPSPLPEPTPPLPYDDDDGDDFPPPPPPLMEDTSKRKEWAKPEPVELEYHESTRLQTINRKSKEYPPTSLEKKAWAEDLLLSLQTMKRTFLNKIGKPKEVASVVLKN